MIFDDYIEFPMSPYDETVFGRVIKLLGSVEHFEDAFQLQFPENESGSEILNEPPTLFDSIDPLIAGKSYRFSIKAIKGQIIFFINGKERSRREEL